MVKKIFIGIGVFLLLLIAFIISAPFLFKGKINAAVKEEINKQLNAKVDYGDFDISIIKTFPNFSFSLNDLCVVGVDSFKGDTLAYIKNFNFTIDLNSVIKGSDYKILALNIIKPEINAKVNYDGRANWDIVKPSKTEGTTSTATPSNFTLNIKEYKIEDANITYNDKNGNSYAKVVSLDFGGNGDVTKDVYDFNTKTRIKELSYKSGSVAYLSQAKLSADINIAVDNKTKKYTFKENSIGLNNLGLKFDGFIEMPESGTNIDLTFKSKETEFRSILSLIPAIYKRDFDKIKTSGSLALSGKVKGVYKGNNLPGFNLDFKIDNAMFQYPDLPVAVTDIDVVADISKPQGGLDLTVVDIPKLHLLAGADPVDGKINVKTPISDPDVIAEINGKMDLANVPKFYPMEGIKTISGMLTVNLNFKGKKSDVDKKDYKAIQASGSAKISNLVYGSKDVPMAVKVSDMQMAFNPQNVTLNSFTAILGKSDFSANGKLENFMAYLFNTGDLSGNLNLKSNVFDSNEWMQNDKITGTAAGGSASKAADTAKTEYFKVPAHINFIANSQFGKIYYDKTTLENVKGEVLIRDEAINLNNLSANLMGGTAKITAKYDTRHTDHPNIDFSYNISNFDMQQTYNTIGMAGKIAPIIKYVQGKFSSELKGSGKMKPDMSVDYNSLKGDGKFQIPDAKIVGLPMLEDVSKLTKISNLQNIELKNAVTTIHFKDGRVNTDPGDLKFGNGFNVHYQGSNGFDQTIDYNVRFDVPTKELGQASTAAQGLLSQIPGLGNVLPAIINFELKITGTVDKPKVALTKVGSSGTSAKDAVKNVVDDLKKKAEEEARKKADELKKQADQQAKQAEDKAKKAAQDAADKAKKDAEQKAKDVFKFPH